MTCTHMHKFPERNSDGTWKMVTRCYREKGKHRKCSHPEKCLFYEEKPVRVKGGKYD